MKRFLLLSFWAIGTTGAFLWVCFWIFGMIYTRKVHLIVFELIALGAIAGWQGFKMFQEEKRRER
jgi:hypothetical protein